MKAPVARKILHQHREHGRTREDEYFWLRDRENPDVIAYLDAENEHTSAAMSRTEPLQERLYEEMRSRIDETETSVPFLENGFYYYRRFDANKEYPIICRKRETLEAEEEIVLDGNELAEGHEFFSFGAISISYDRDRVAFSIDTVGRRIYTIHVKDLGTGELLEAGIEDTTGNVAWANDNQTLFYTRQEPATLRPYRLFRHRVGEDAASDPLVYEEEDETFSIGISKTKSRKFLLLIAQHTLRSECRYIDASEPEGEFQLFLERQGEREYYPDHFGDHFYIMTNDDAVNFRLMRCPISDTRRSAWEEVIEHRPSVLLEDVEIFENFLVLTERGDGLIQIRVRPWVGDGEHYLEFDEPAYDAGTEINRSFETPLLRFSYESMTTPESIYEYDMRSRKKTLLKQKNVLGGFESANYVTDRLHAIARDGTKIPISILHRKGVERDSSNPLLLYGYGSYGHSIDPSFSSSRISLVDRGFVFAIAHIRGGEELGRPWYEDGKKLRKMNSFTDFIDCGEQMIEQGYTSTKKLYAMGGSAGGLLVGAVVNLRPDLFHGVVAQVPFVDVVTTMFDDSIPLTTGEYDEWGDPRDLEYFEYMLSYSPYDNVEAKEYPHMLVTTGLHDSQVQYWEPAKWVARLRDLKLGGNQLLLKTNMSAGHGGASGRYRALREIATEFAFLLDLEGVEG